jgi:hypothetical protein
MVPQLQTQLASFKERAKSDPGIQVVGRGGERGGGAFGLLGALLLAGVASAIGRRHV